MLLCNVDSHDGNAQRGSITLRWLGYINASLCPWASMSSVSICRQFVCINCYGQCFFILSFHYVIVPACQCSNWLLFHARRKGAKKTNGSQSSPPPAQQTNHLTINFRRSSNIYKYIVDTDVFGPTRSSWIGILTGQRSLEGSDVFNHT